MYFSKLQMPINLKAITKASINQNIFTTQAHQLTIHMSVQSPSRPVNHCD